MFANAYKGRRVFLTGHTGFKGSWLALWLKTLGAEVTALALPPDTSPNHWDLLKLGIESHHADIRDASAVERILVEARPDIIFHLAAQPLVRHSYRDPLETWSTNVMGTAHVLEACRKAPSLRAIVVATTDKVYANLEQDKAYRETDALGGHDPYSASKAASELVADSYRKSFFHAPGSPLLATVRAGNVIGGGDWSQDRLIPDLARAIGTGAPLEIRSPRSTRPWQHVLESLSGYLLLGQKLLEGQKACAEAWNFGPSSEDNRTVAEILDILKKRWPDMSWKATNAPQPHEAGLLHIDSSKSRRQLGWHPVWRLEQALDATADWYKAYLQKKDVISLRQLDDFTQAAREVGHAWAQGGAFTHARSEVA